MNVRAAPVEEVEAFADRLGRLRREARLHQEDVARRLGCSQRAVSLWESGARVPSAYFIAQLADVFGVTMGELWRGHR